MFYPKLRGVMLMCSMTAMLSAMPVESRGCCLLDNLFGGGSARTTYRMPYVTAYTPACTSCTPTSCVSYAPQTCCYAPQTCCYVPQTCYYVPQTCYRTVYRPLLTWSFRPLLVPYTTYRAVYSNPCATCNPCIGGACGTVTYSGTTTSFGSSCPSCIPAATPSSSIPAARPEPATFQQNSPPQIQKTLKPIPKIDTQLNSTPAPSLIDPSSRTTLRPIRQASYNRLVATDGPTLTAENGGWRASRD